MSELSEGLPPEEVAIDGGGCGDDKNSRKTWGFLPRAVEMEEREEARSEKGRWRGEKLLLP